jgi:hypothetical protein
MPAQLDTRRLLTELLDRDQIRLERRPDRATRRERAFYEEG